MTEGEALCRLSNGASCSFHMCSPYTGEYRIPYWNAIRRDDGKHLPKNIPTKARPMLFFITVLLLIVASRATDERDGFGTSLDSVADRSELNRRIQLLGFQAFNRRSVRTGTVYNVSMPADLVNVSVQVVRLRTGSLRRRGFTFNEISIPVGARPITNLRSVVLIYRNFNNYQTYVSTVRGEELVTPVVGVLVYDASNLTTTYPLPELIVIAAENNPIVVQFSLATSSSNLSCVFYNVSGSGNATVEQSSLSTNRCTWDTLGDYSLVAPISVPRPSSHHHSNVWKIVVGAVVGAVVLLSLFVLLALLAVRYRERAKISRMEHMADHGETLQTTSVGGSRAPTAAGTRTKPILENEFMS